ncbi:hypothetical protein GCM10010359_58470 [Streptomyces morookaense]|nr:hypothetical protein GCM10010359_58470 [Streptomyces morookaense]
MTSEIGLHQPCHIVFAVMSRSTAVPHVRQKGPSSFRNLIMTRMPWCPRTVASTVGTAPHSRQPECGGWAANPGCPQAAPPGGAGWGGKPCGGPKEAGCC